jgi:hypothetical protein
MAIGPQFLQTMSGREKRLIGVLLFLALLAVAGFGYFVMGDKIAVMEEELAEAQEAMEEIRLRATDYLGSQRRKKALEDAIRDNKATIQTAIDSLARKVEVTQLQGAQGATTTFNKILRFEAKTTERAIYLGQEKKSKRNRDKSSDFVELSQPAEYSFVRFLDLIKFLEQLESPDRLMYVSKLTITRKYGDAEYVQGKLTVSTFIHKPHKEEEK